MHQDATWYGGRRQPKRLCIRRRPSPLPQKGGGAPQFSAYVYCGETAGCLKMPLGMEVGLSPGDCVRWGPSPSPKGSRAPEFSAQMAAWIKMPLGTEISLSPDDTVLDGEPDPPPQKGGGALLPNFRPMSIVAKRLDGSRWHLAWRWALVQATLC